jgi:hypothetical protein
MFDMTLTDVNPARGLDDAAWRALLAGGDDASSRAQLAAWFAPHGAPELLAHSVLRAEDAALRAGEGPADPVFSSFLRLMPPHLLGQAVLVEPQMGWRRDFMLLMAERLPPGVALHVVDHALAALGAPLAPPVRTLLDGIVQRCANGDPVPLAEFRVLLARHVNAMCAEPVHSVTRGFEQLYDHRIGRRTAGRATPEPERMLQLAIETGVAGRTTWLAWSELVEAGRSRDVLDLLKVAPAENEATIALASRFATVRGIAQLLEEETVDFAALDVIIGRMGANAASALVEALAESRSRAVRDALFERLSKLGTAVTPFAEHRLKDSRWFVVRNMLGLLRVCGGPGAAAHGGRFLDHDDARVRREAVLLLATDAQSRDRAIAAGLKDQDRHVVQAAIHEARANLPDIAVPVLAKRLNTGDFPRELRVRAIQLLGRKSSMLALEALLRHSQAGRTLLGKPRLAPTSPEVRAAVAGLARTWKHDRRARAVLEAAARSRDTDIARAANGSSEK